MDTQIAIALLAVAIIHFLYRTYVDSTKDVNELYLNEQSLAEDTRLVGQSAIYKSTKLEYGNGLRVGLDIRYDSYKIRNGNFCDVWELMVKHLKTDPEKRILVDDDSVKISVLNAMVHFYGQRLRDGAVKTLGIPIDRFLEDAAGLGLVLACLVNDVLVHLYDDIANIDVAEIDAFTAEPVKPFATAVPTLEPVLTFENVYSFEKDRGKRLKITRKLNSRVVSSVDFLPINFMSSVAATIKHLPPHESISAHDRLVVVRSGTSNQDITQALTKIFTGFVCQSDVIVTSNATWDNVAKYNPTIVSMSQEAFGSSFSIAAAKSRLGLVQTAKYYQTMNFLARGKFSRPQDAVLRVLYLHKPIDAKKRFSTSELNQIRALLGARVIVENCHNNLTGPVILGDFYDYRLLPAATDSEVTGHGCICQSLEIKLVNLDADDKGEVQIRGYNIGKGNETFIGKGVADNSKRDNDGFMSLSHIKGKWGKDGCLYIYN